MAFFFGDGFDLYAAITDAATYWDASLGSSATLSLSAGGRFAGSRGIAMNTTQANSQYLTKTSGQNDGVHHFSFAFIQTTTLTGVNQGLVIYLNDGATTQCSLLFRTDGLLSFNLGAIGAQITTFAGVVPAQNTWYQFEIEVVIHNTAGSIAIRRNGNTVNDFFQGSLNTRSSTNNYANKIGLGSNWNSSGAQIMDDFLWRSDASSVAWAGDIRCYTRMPASDASVQFTRSGSVAPVTPYAASSTVTSAANGAKYSPFIATCDGSVGSVVLTTSAAMTGNAKCSLFANLGSNLPGAVLGSATPIANPVLGSNTFTFGTPVAVTRGTPYWVGFDVDTATTGFWATATGSPSAGLYNSQGASLTVTYASFPTANPAVVTGAASLVFTVNITPTTLANAQMAAEVTQDGANSYVYSSTVGQSDLYNLGSISATPGSIVGVTTRAYLEKSDVGTRIAAVQLQSGASNVQGSLTLNTTWAWAFRNDLVDPATGAAWTATGVNNAQIGVTVTA